MTNATATRARRVETPSRLRHGRPDRVGAQPRIDSPAAVSLRQPRSLSRALAVASLAATGVLTLGTLGAAIGYGITTLACRAVPIRPTTASSDGHARTDGC